MREKTRDEISWMIGDSVKQVMRAQTLESDYLHHITKRLEAKIDALDNAIARLERSTELQIESVPCVQEARAGDRKDAEDKEIEAAAQAEASRIIRARAIAFRAHQIVDDQENTDA